MAGLLGNVIGVATGVVAVEAITSMQRKLYDVEGVYARWPRRVAAFAVAVGGFAIAAKSKPGFGYEAAEGLAMAGLTQGIQQIWGELI